MKNNQLSKGRIAKPLLSELVKRQHADFRRVVSIASVGSSNSPFVTSTRLRPPNLYQDSGSGFNQNLSFIQE